MAEVIKEAGNDAADQPEAGAQEASLESLLGGVLHEDEEPKAPAEDAGGEGNEAPDEAEPDASAGEAKDGAADEEEESKEKPNGFLKRINKLTRRLAESQERFTQTESALRQEIERLKHGAQAPAPAQHAGELTEQRLDAEEAEAEAVRDAIDSYLDETAGEKDRAQVEAYMQRNGLDQAGLKRMARQLKRTVEVDIPKRRRAMAEYQQQAAAAEPHVDEYVPFMNDPEDPLYAEAQKVVQALPELRRLPHWKLTAGVYVLGLQKFAEMRAVKQGKAKPAAAAKTPPPQPGKPALGASGSGRDQDDYAAERKRFFETGDPVSANQFLARALRNQGVLK